VRGGDALFPDYFGEDLSGHVMKFERLLNDYCCLYSCLY